MSINNENYIEDIKLNKSCCFDWFSFTLSNLEIKEIGAEFQIMNYETYDDLLRLLTIFDFETQTKSYGRNGYRNGIQLFEGASIYYGGDFCKNQFGQYTLMVDITGMGCRNFESRGGNWFKLFKWLKENDYTAGRLDLAIDDYTGNEIKLEEVYDLICMKKSYSSLPRKANFLMAWNKNKDDTYSLGTTINLGNRASKCSICIYDKLCEQRNKNVFEKLSYHVRYEMRFKKEMASRLIDEYLVNFNDSPLMFLKYVSSTLYEVLDIKEDNGIKRITNRPTYKGWLDFLGEVYKIDLKSEAKVITSLEKKEVWFKEDLPATLLELLITKSSSLDEFITSVMKDKLNKGKIPAKTLHRINSFFLEKHGVIDSFSEKSLIEYLNKELKESKGE